MDICDYIDESGETLFFIYMEVIMRIKNPNAKRGAHSKEFTASAQKKMDDALADMFSSKD